MKNYYLITKEAAKYWKKAIKNDLVMICNHNDSIYIVNGYNAFQFPAMPAIWDEIARAAFLVEMPGEGVAFQYIRGEKHVADPVNIVKIFTRATEDTTPATRTPFQFDSNDRIMRLYKNDNGSISGVNVVYDAMVDTSRADSIYCGGRYSPVIFKNNFGFTAVIMPVKLENTFPEKIRNTFTKLLEA